MKKIVGIFMSFLIAVNLCACGKHEHQHTWKEATCTTRKTCTRCGVTEGEPLGHKVDEWSQKSASTCTEHGTECGICSVCGETVEHELPLLEHIPGDWEIVTMPTENSKGTRKRICTVCGKTITKEKFSLSDEELKDIYISKCKTIPYESLCRTPDQYKGEYVKYSGYVVQICSEAASSSEYSLYRVATSGRYNNIVFVLIDNYGSGSRILEDDHITFYGTYDGLHTYETVRGDSLTIPRIKVAYLN